MSGGHFDYGQYRIEEIADKIAGIVERETSPRPALVKKKELTAWVWNKNRGIWHPTFTTSIEKEHQRYKVHEDMREVSDIVVDGKTKKFTATDYCGIRYEVAEWESEHYYDDNGDELYYHDFTPQTIEEFRKAVKILKRAYVYAQRIDYLISCDDSEESFHERLQEELAKLK